MNHIEAQYLSNGIQSGAELFLPPAEAIRLIRSYREAKIPVLGADGFLITSDGIQPQFDQILDLSSLTGGDCWTEAEDFLEARLFSPYHFVIVADDQHSP
jgi:hypothetical protein